MSTTATDWRTLIDDAERVLIVLGLLGGVGSLLVYALGMAMPTIVPVGILLLLQSVHLLGERLG